MKGLGKQSKLRPVKTSNPKLSRNYFVSLSGKKTVNRDRALSVQTDKCGFSLSKDHSIVLDRLYSPGDFQVVSEEKKNPKEREKKGSAPRSPVMRKITLSNKKSQKQVTTENSELNIHKIAIRGKNPSSPTFKLRKKSPPLAPTKSNFQVVNKQLKIIKEFPEKKPKRKWQF